MPTAPTIDDSAPGRLFGTDTHIDVTFPGGTPANGKTITLALWTQGGSSALSMTAPSGFTVKKTIFTNNGFQNVELTVWEKLAASETGATYSISFASAFYRMSMIGIVSGGVDTTTPFEAIADAEAGFADPIVCPSVTTLTDNALQLVIVGEYDHDFTGTTVPSGYTEIIEANELYACYKVITTHGASGTCGVPSPSDTGTTTAYSIAVKPGSGGGGTVTPQRSSIIRQAIQRAATR